MTSTFTCDRTGIGSREVVVAVVTTSFRGRPGKSWLIRRNDERLRNMYAGGRANTIAKRYSRFWATVFRLGLQPRRWVTLEVVGRKTGNQMRVPLGMADWHGNWYLVSMLGDCNWVRNVRAAAGHATLHRRRSRRVLLTEVQVKQRAAILKRYLEAVPGGRPHIPVDWREPVESFQAIAAGYPVFLVQMRAAETS